MKHPPQATIHAVQLAKMLQKASEDNATVDAQLLQTAAEQLQRLNGELCYQRNRNKRLRARLKATVAALTNAERTFDGYAQHHARKAVPDLDKVKANFKLANEMAFALHEATKTD